jgi:hypothetical protein|tara:strand:- start:447 stop:584 length:138 start_codon:yes stop_codon:yes gene_type:complete
MNTLFTIKLTETQNGGLSADIDKIIKKEQNEQLNNDNPSPSQTSL